MGKCNSVMDFNNARQPSRPTLHVPVINSCGEGLVNNSLMPNGYQWDQTMHLADTGRSIHCCTQNKGECGSKSPVKFWLVNKNLAVTLHNKDHA